MNQTAVERQRWIVVRGLLEQIIGHLATIDVRLDILSRQSQTILNKEIAMSNEVDALVAEVAAVKATAAALKDASDKSEALMDKLFALLQGAVTTGDLAAVKEQTDALAAERASIAQETADLVAAVGRDTPAEPAPAVEPTTTENLAGPQPPADDQPPQG